MRARAALVHLRGRLALAAVALCDECDAAVDRLDGHVSAPGEHPAVRVEVVVSAFVGSADGRAVAQQVGHLSEGRGTVRPRED